MYGNTNGVLPEAIKSNKLFKNGSWCAVEFITESREYSVGEIKAIVSNIFEEIIGNQGIHGKVIEGHGCLLCLVNFCGGDIKSNMDSLQDAILLMTEMIDKYFNISVKASIGNVYPNIKGAVSSCREAEKSMYYKIFYNMPGIVVASDLLNSKTEKTEAEDNVNKLFGMLKSKKVDNALEVILNKAALEDKLLANNDAYTNIINMLIMLVGKAFDKNVEKRQFYYEQVFFLIKPDNDSEKTRKTICGLLKDISDEITDEEAGMAGFKTRDVAEYIQNNYNKPELSVAYISEVFRIHPNTLSRKFKNDFEMDISWYIQYIRIKESKRYLNDSGLTLEHIAQLVGYGSAKTYIRNFKKFENVTPRVYADSKDIL